MKKIISMLLLVVMMLTMLASCAYDDTKISVGVLNGPTGMGMAKLMHDNKDSSDLYSFTSYDGPAPAISELASGKINMLCLPTNQAANLSIKQADYLSVIAINTLGSLYLVTNDANSVSSFKDLDGKTVYTSVPGSTTKPIIEYLARKNNITITIDESSVAHSDLIRKVKTGEAPIAVVPEPLVSQGLADTPYKVRLNISEEWDKVSDTPLAMGCIVVRNDFLTAHKGAVDRFLKDYKASIEYVSNENNAENAVSYIVEAGIIKTEKATTSALNNLRSAIVYSDGKAMKDALKAFYTAINQAQPADEFYYEK